MTCDRAGDSLSQCGDMERKTTKHKSSIFGSKTERRKAEKRKA